MRTLRPWVLRMLACNRQRRISTLRWENFCCPTELYATAQMQTVFCSAFFRAHMKLRRTWPVGTVSFLKDLPARSVTRLSAPSSHHVRRLLCTKRVDRQENSDRGRGMAVTCYFFGASTIRKKALVAAPMDAMAHTSDAI